MTVTTGYNMNTGTPAAPTYVDIGTKLAPIDSPNFTGTPQINSVNIATTADVTNATSSTALSSYVTSTSLTSSLASYATTAALASYVTTSTLATNLASYVGSATLASYVTATSLTTALASYVTTDSLASYATTASLASYATTASLASYATRIVTVEGIMEPNILNPPYVLNGTIGYGYVVTNIGHITLSIGKWMIVFYGIGWIYIGKPSMTVRKDTITGTIIYDAGVLIENEYEIKTQFTRVFVTIVTTNPTVYYLNLTNQIRMTEANDTITFYALRLTDIV